MTYRQKPVKLNVGELALLVKLIAFRAGARTCGAPEDMAIAKALLKRTEELCAAWGVEADMVHELSRVETADQLWNKIEALEAHRVKLLRLRALRREVGCMAIALVPSHTSTFMIETICEEVAKAFGLDVAALRVKTRIREVIEPRQVACYLARQMFRMPLNRIGQYFHQDHGTVVHSYRTVSERMSIEPMFKLKVESLQAICKERFSTDVETTETPVLLKAL